MTKVGFEEVLRRSLGEEVLLFTFVFGTFSFFTDNAETFEDTFVEDGLLLAGMGVGVCVCVGGFTLC
jgi:hypothetical protein